MIKSNTCIAVLRKTKTGKLIFAADRRLSMENSVQAGPRPKIVHRDGMILAGSGCAYLCDLITELCEIPQDNNLTAFEYMHHVFYNNIVEILKQKGLRNEEGDSHASWNAEILVGYKSELFDIDINMEGVQINAVNPPLAIGCGGDYALAVLTALKDTKMSEKCKLQVALCTAADLTPGCDKNIDYAEE